MTCAGGLEWLIMEVRNGISASADALFYDTSFFVSLRFDNCLTKGRFL